MTESKTDCTVGVVVAAASSSAAGPLGMQALSRRRPLLATLMLVPMLGCAPLIVDAAPAAATTMPATPATPATAATDQAALEKQLDAARARLDESAREVADLTRQLHGGDEGDVMRFVHGGPRGAMLGINIGEQKRDEGVEIQGVSPSGPAQAAGLRKGDVLVAIDGKPLRRNGDTTPSRQLVDYLRSAKPGQVVKLDYTRDGKKASASVTTSEAEPPMARMVREHLGGMMPRGFEEFIGHRRPFGALELVTVTPKLGQYFGTDKGLLVLRAPSAPGMKLEEGDVIMALDGRVPENPRHAFRILGSYQPNEKVKVDVLRQRKRTTVELLVPEAPQEGEEFVPPVPGVAPMPPMPPHAPKPPQPDTTSS